MEKARKLHWIESMLNHIAGEGFDEEDAAEWLAFYVGERHDASFTLASDNLGIPLIEQMNEASA